MYLDGNSFIITPPFSPSAIWVTNRRRLFSRQFPPGKPYGFVVRLHLGNEFGVAALRFDYGNDARRFALGVAANKAMRDVLAFRSTAGLRQLHGMLLHKDPLIAAILQRLHELVGHIGWLGKAISEGEKPRTRLSASRPNIAAN